MSAYLVVYAVVLAAPVALGYCWWFYVARMQTERGAWRSRVTVVSLVLVSVAAALWVPTMLLFPHTAAFKQQVDWMVFGFRVAMSALLAAFVLCFLGRPRLILPTVAACVGFGALWFFSALPFD